MSSSDLPGNVAHLMRQVADGEFGIFKREAREIGPEAFAEKYGHSVWLWGRPDPIYKCVRHEGTDYLWRLSDGGFDGWDGINLPPQEHRP
jgi:hypothetical protein